MHKRNLAAVWLPWLPTKLEEQEPLELKAENTWVQEEEKLKNARAQAEVNQETLQERLNRVLPGYDLKKTVL